MRPIELKGKGFTSFRHEFVLRFDSLDLFAITGPTGAGKSSLIDAMLYALYGRTPRVGERRIADLITQGCSRLDAQLTFLVHRKEYRVTRTMRRAQQLVSKALLERRDADGEWESLVSGISAVRSSVERLLGLDFAGFTKAVVLPQGEFDEFLKGNPSERRRLLSDLLQLGTYEAMGQRARELAERLSGEAQARRGLLEANYSEAQPARRTRLLDELRSAKRGAQASSKRLESIKKLMERAVRLREERVRERSTQEELARMEAEATSLSREDKRLEKQIAIQQEAGLEVEKRIAATGYDEGLSMRLAQWAPLARQLRERLDESAEVQGALSKRESENRQIAEDLKEARHKEEQAGKHEKETLEGLQELRRVWEERTSLGGLEAIRGALELLSKREGLQAEAERQVSEVADLRARFQEVSSQTQALGERIAAAERGLSEARLALEHVRRMHSAADLRRGLKPGVECPVCLRILEGVPEIEEPEQLVQRQEDEVHRRKELVRLKDEAVRLGEMRQSILRDKAVGEAALGRTESELDDLDSRLARTVDLGSSKDHRADLEKSAAELEALEAALRRAETAARASEAARREAQATRLHLEREARLLSQALQESASHAQRSRKQVEELKARLAEAGEIESIETDYVAQQKAQREARRLQERLDLQCKALEEKRSLLERTRQRLRDLGCQMERVVQELEKSRKRIADRRQALAAEIGKLQPDLPLFGDAASEKAPREGEDEAGRLEALREEEERKRRECESAAARLEEQTESLERLIEQSETIRQEVKSLEQERNLARELGQCLRANQFMAFVQEEVLHRLAEYGTIHLREITSDRYSLAAKDDAFQVIDHWNADETRPADTLSGGESFLASLALALALSQSLTEVGSAKGTVGLESLFLDEGFSSLDTETLDIVLQGIEKLARDDRMIGIVSHVAELADRLPSRVRVVKSIEGSSLESSIQ